MSTPRIYGSLKNAPSGWYVQCLQGRGETGQPGETITYVGPYASKRHAENPSFGILLRTIKHTHDEYTVRVTYNDDTGKFEVRDGEGRIDASYDARHAIALAAKCAHETDAILDLTEVHTCHIVRFAAAAMDGSTKPEVAAQTIERLKRDMTPEQRAYLETRELAVAAANVNQRSVTIWKKPNGHFWSFYVDGDERGEGRVECIAPAKKGGDS